MGAPQTPRRPYLVRAMHEWMTANNQTPHLVVDAASEVAEVPRASLPGVVLSGVFLTLQALLLPLLHWHDAKRPWGTLRPVGSTHT